MPVLKSTLPPDSIMVAEYFFGKQQCPGPGAIDWALTAKVERSTPTITETIILGIVESSQLSPYKYSDSTGVMQLLDFTRSRLVMALMKMYLMCWLPLRLFTNTLQTFLIYRYSMERRCALQVLSL